MIEIWYNGKVKDQKTSSIYNDRNLIQWEGERSKDCSRHLSTKLGTTGSSPQHTTSYLYLIITLTYLDLIIILTGSSIALSIHLIVWSTEACTKHSLASS